MRSSQQVTPIKNVLETIICKISGEKKDASQKFQEAWQQIVDKEVYKHARPTSFRLGKLIVNVDSSAWLYEINLRKSNLKQALNKHLGAEELIKDIVLRVGKIY